MLLPYWGELVEAILRQDGLSVRRLLRVEEGVRHSPFEQVAIGVLDSYEGYLSATWLDILLLHWETLVAVEQPAPILAYEKAVAVMQHFLKVFREDAAPWVVHPMHAVVHNVWTLAQAADTTSHIAGRRSDKLGDCADQLRKCFAVSLQAPGNKDKKLAALDIVNVSIKIYFKLNTLRLCKNLTRTVGSPQFADFDMFPASQRVTYKFYVGRLAVLDENFHEARECLAYALQHCHSMSLRNQRLVLKYLVPVQLLLGVLPSQQLMARFALQEYDPVVQAVRLGDMSLFSSTMLLHQGRFIQEGTYLLLEKLRYAVYRQLLKKVWILHGCLSEDRTRSHVPLAAVQQALALQGIEADMDEVECVCANLVCRRFVKGYIAHKQKILVVSKADPFPLLSQTKLSAA